MFAAVVSAVCQSLAVTVLTSPDVFTYAYVAAEAMAGDTITNVLEMAILAIRIERIEVVIRIFVLSSGK